MKKYTPFNPWRLCDDVGTRRVIKEVPGEHKPSCEFMLDCHAGFDHPRDCSYGKTIVVIDDWTKEEDARLISVAPLMKKVCELVIDADKANKSDVFEVLSLAANFAQQAIKDSSVKGK